MYDVTDLMNFIIYFDELKEMTNKLIFIDRTGKTTTFKVRIDSSFFTFAQASVRTRYYLTDMMTTRIG